MKALIILLAIFLAITALAVFLPDKSELEGAADTFGSFEDSSDQSSDETDSPYSLSGKWRLKTPNTAVDLRLVDRGISGDYV